MKHGQTLRRPVPNLWPACPSITAVFSKRGGGWRREREDAPTLEMSPVAKNVVQVGLEVERKSVAKKTHFALCGSVAINPSEP